MSPAPLTGVNPVPPSMRESKFKAIPADGVVIGTPATSEIVVGTGFGWKTETGRELGLDGLLPPQLARSASIGFLGGLGSDIGAMTESSSYIMGFTSGGEGGCASVPAKRQFAL